MKADLSIIKIAKVLFFNNAYLRLCDTYFWCVL